MFQVATAAVVGLLGLCLGSYVVTAALRSVRSEQSIFGQSHCDHCETPLSFVQTTPIIGYLSRRGVCDICGGRIEPIHLLGELLGGLMLLGAYLLTPLAEAPLVGALGLALLASAVVDAKSRRLPDPLTGLVAVLALILDAAVSWRAVAVGLASAAISFALLETIRRGFLRFRGAQGLGFGDVKLIAALALWLGLATPWSIMIAAAMGLAGMAVFRPPDGRLAFGPYIAVAGWCVGLAREAQVWPLSG